MHENKTEMVLPHENTRYICEERELEGFDLARMFDDFRGCGDFEMDEWVQDVETLFSFPEILSLFCDPT